MRYWQIDLGSCTGTPRRSGRWRAAQAPHRGMVTGTGHLGWCGGNGLMVDDGDWSTIPNEPTSSRIRDLASPTLFWNEYLHSWKGSAGVEVWFLCEITGSEGVDHILKYSDHLRSTQRETHLATSISERLCEILERKARLIVVGSVPLLSLTYCIDLWHALLIMISLSAREPVFCQTWLRRSWRLSKQRLQPCSLASLLL